MTSYPPHGNPGLASEVKPATGTPPASDLKPNGSGSSKGPKMTASEATKRLKGLKRRRRKRIDDREASRRLRKRGGSREKS